MCEADLKAVAISGSDTAPPFTKRVNFCLMYL